MQGWCACTKSLLGRRAESFCEYRASKGLRESRFRDVRLEILANPSTLVASPLDGKGSGTIQLGSVSRVKSGSCWKFPR